MVNWLMRAVVITTWIPLSMVVIGLSLKYHLILMGKSPFNAMHCTAAISSVFNGASPKVNGKICGGTKLKSTMMKIHLFSDFARDTKKPAPPVFKFVYVLLLLRARGISVTQKLIQHTEWANNMDSKSKEKEQKWRYCYIRVFYEGAWHSARYWHDEY